MNMWVFSAHVGIFPNLKIIFYSEARDPGMPAENWIILRILKYELLKNEEH